MKEYYLIGIQVWKKYDENYKIKELVTILKKQICNELIKLSDSQTRILRRIDDVSVNMQVLNQVQNLHRPFFTI